MQEVDDALIVTESYIIFIINILMMCFSKKIKSCDECIENTY